LAIALCATLRAYKSWQPELMENDFEQHPTLVPTFNSFLFTKGASVVEIQIIETKFTAMDKPVIGLQRKVGGLLTGRDSRGHITRK
jgi:hypothetical protein